MDQLSRQRRGRQRPPDPWGSGRGLSARIGHQPDHGRAHREGRLKALIVVLPAVLLAAAAAAGTPSKPASKGERAYQKCHSCHALDRRSARLDGPSLHRIVGRRIAAERGFAYSPALRRFARRHPRWTRALLGRFAAGPEALVPGTSMNFHGIADPKERRALVKYLERSDGRAR